MEIDRNGLEILDRDTCLQLLRGATVGRVAVTANALPSVLPVNFLVIDDQVVFRTAAGSKLEAATQHSVVAFEVDDFDPVSHTGWSVVVTGVARPLKDDEIDATTKLHIPRWAPGNDGHVVAISTERITGRRIDPTAR
jgi:nitroimidazol reductase NimA-like FMN-containing flavoprotein (pyridoxamine 5'-phosphate oxidase superfamily)